MAVTPIRGTNTQVVTGGVPVTAAPGGLNGGYITNPAYATDQGIAYAEKLLVDPVAPPSLLGNQSTVVLQPGETYTLIPFSTSPVYVNAPTSGHKFTCVTY